MKKVIIILFVIMFWGCSDYYRKEPVEKYFGKNYIIWKISPSTDDKDITVLRLRNKKGFVEVPVLNFDIKLFNLKVGDTLK